MCKTGGGDRLTNALASNGTQNCGASWFVPAYTKNHSVQRSLYPYPQSNSVEPARLTVNKEHRHQYWNPPQSSWVRQKIETSREGGVTETSREGGTGLERVLRGNFATAKELLDLPSWRALHTNVTTDYERRQAHVPATRKPGKARWKGEDDFTKSMARETCTHWQSPQMRGSCKGRCQFLVERK